MEQVYTITTSNGIYRIYFRDRDQFIDEIEDLTGILAIDQAYYCSGERLYSLESALNFPQHEFQIIGKKQGSAKYFIRTSKEIIKLYVTNFMVKTVKDLLSAFTTACRKKNCIYPSEKYSFKYNNLTLNLTNPLSEIPPESDIKLIKKSKYPPLQLLSLNIKTINNKHFQIEIYSLETVQALKDSEIKCGAPINEFKLVLNGHELEDEKTLDTYQINNKSEILSIFKGKGGAVDIGFIFFELGVAKLVKFAKTSEKWRIVKPGFSWTGICENKICKAYKQYVYSNLGLGIFQVSFQRNKARCPECKKLLNSLYGCGFYNCKFYYEGYDAENNNVKAKGKADKDSYTAFWGSSEKKWKWLSIEVVEVDQEYELCKEEYKCKEVIIKGLSSSEMQ